MTTIPTPLGDLEISGWTLVWTAVTVLGTYVVARLAVAATVRLGDRVDGIPDDFVLQAARIVRYFVIIIGVGIELSVLGAPVQPVLAAVIVVLVGVFLMLRGIADNFGAALMIQTRHPLHLGDLVESHGYLGHVSDLNSRSVVLETQDGLSVHLPNSQVMGGAMVNHSAHGHARSEVELRAVTSDPEALSLQVLDLLTRVPGVLPRPRPHVLVTSFAPEHARLLLQVWHAPDVGPEVCSRVLLEARRGLLESEVTVAVDWPPPPPPLTPPGEL